MRTEQQVMEIFNQMSEEAGETTASALLVLAVVLRDSFKELDHALALGIRKGLFGADASDNESLEKFK
jgi:hypothetical protein